MPSRDEIILEYFDRLPYPPYPIQEEAMYAWAACEDGVLLSAPTGTGKTLVAEAAVYEALRTGRGLYYSTPLIALTDQKLLELQETVARWGYERDSVGLVTGHRTVNPHAPVKVVVAEVLLNRLLHPEIFDFADVGAVVMDEFHNFNEPQRGIVWELALSLLPRHVRVMLLSATVGAAHEFVNWMARSLERRVTLVEGTQRKVPLHFEWIGDELLPDFIERMAQGKGGAEAQRRTPALVFCFDRNVCWDTAEVLKGKDVFAEGQRAKLLARLEEFDFSVGSGPKLKTFLTRGIGIHHAGLLPRYRRVVETLFQEKLLPICVCTETLAAGINLPARSVVLTTLVKGPKDKKRLIDAGSAQQMFGRAGRPQFDTEGYVYVLAHEDDVRLAKWKVKYDSIPEDEKDPALMKAKKQLLKKKPTRRDGVTYWNAEQFARHQTVPPAKLSSKGRLTWRWLAYLLEANPQVQPIRQVIRARLMDQPTVDAEIKRLTRMLVTLAQMNVVTLEPTPPEEWKNAAKPAGVPVVAAAPKEGEEDDEDGEGTEAKAGDTGTRGQGDKGKELPVGGRQLPVDGQSAIGNPQSAIPAPAPAARNLPTVAELMAKLKLGEPIGSAGAGRGAVKSASGKPAAPPGPPPYDPVTATPTPRLKDLTVFRAVHPLYGLFLIGHLAKADDAELVQILESLLEMPGSVAKLVRVPWPSELPPGPLATGTVDPALLMRGVATQEDLYPSADQSDLPPALRKYPIPLAQKMRLFFESEVDHAGGLFVTPVWAVGDFLERNGGISSILNAAAGANLKADAFDKYVRACDLIKQEGILFKHFLRMILLCDEFAQLTPDGAEPEAWRRRLAAIADVLTKACRDVDPQSTDELLEELAEDAG